jgi:hypothetical protein
MEWDRPVCVQRVGAGVAVRWEPQCVCSVCTGSPAVWLALHAGHGCRLTKRITDPAV